MIELMILQKGERCRGDLLCRKDSPPNDLIYLSFRIHLPILHNYITPGAAVSRSDNNVTRAVMGREFQTLDADGSKTAAW